MTASLHALSSGRDAGLYYVNDPQRESRPSRRDEYYANDGAGVWWSTGETVVRNGSAIDRDTFRDLCGGFDPRSGKGLVRASGPTHRAGWDFTFSAPKSVSILWMAGDAAQRDRIFALHRAAVDRALQLFTSEELLDVRLGQGGYLREKPTDVIIGRFSHFTSREGDCNLHDHCVLINVLGCKDGKWRTAETERAFANLMVLGAAYRAELASGLRRIGLHIREAGRGQFEIAGLPQHLIDRFSKRSLQINKAVGRGASTLQKEMATLATRAAKDTVPVGNALEERWTSELAKENVDPWNVAYTYQPGPKQEADASIILDQPPIERNGPVSSAACDLFQHQSVIDRKELLRRSFVNASLGADDVDNVFTELTALEDSGLLQRLAGDKLSSCWTSPIIAATEASLLRSADRFDERDWLHPDILTKTLSKADHLSAEQADAVRIACGRDGLTICEAAAGTGKTTLARVIVQAAQQSGMTILGLAPTWVAADELSNSTRIASLSIAKWRYDYRLGAAPPIDANTLIVIDEVSLCGLGELEDILRNAKHHKAKVICLGDRRQLEAVANGNPLKAVYEITKRSATMTEVRRQQIGWQRAASTLMAKGDVASGLRAYARHQRIQLVSGEQALYEQTIRYWTEWRERLGEDVALITRRNADANKLNNAARAVLLTEKKLTGPEVLVDTIDREKNFTRIGIAQGDRIRFGENLVALGVRNGTRGTILKIEPDSQNPRVRIRLDSGTSIEQTWSSLASNRFGKRSPPRISFAYAGTAYSVQGRTTSAAIVMVNKQTDARELYVGLTRHRNDAIVIAEKDRLVGEGKLRHPTSYALGGDTLAFEQLMREACSYSEKANVVDYVQSREDFINSGIVNLQNTSVLFNLADVARAARSLITTLGSRIRGGLTAGVNRERSNNAGGSRFLMQRFANFLDDLKRSLERARDLDLRLTQDRRRSYDLDR